MMELVPALFKKRRGNNQYSVIITGCNVERSIDKLMKSLIGQSLDFGRNIFLIFVDDDSTDKTSDKMRAWVQKYPANILFLSKSSLGDDPRNLGLEHVKTPWVTFIRGQDFISRDYFFKIDQLLDKTKIRQASLINCNSVLYTENSKRFKKFSEDNLLHTRAGVATLPSVNSIFFKMEFIQKHELKFRKDLDTREMNFLGTYLFYVDESDIHISPESIYYLRKKKQGGKVEISNQKISKITGHCDLINFYKGSDKQLPPYMQQMIFLDLANYINNAMKSLQSLELDEQQKGSVEKGIEEILKFISVETIRNYRSSALNEVELMGLLGRYKGVTFNSIEIIADDYDFIEESIKVIHHCYFDEIVTFEVNGISRSANYSKVVTSNFNGRLLYQQKIYWLKLKSKETLRVFVNDKSTKIRFGDNYFFKLECDLVVKKLTENEIKPQNSIYKDCWIFMDREDQADDNAEHLYRYIKSIQNFIPIFYAIKKSSHDWHRLKSEGFNLVDIQSKLFNKLFRESSMFISSHIHNDVLNLMKKNLRRNRQYVFLQHGVIGTDLSKWLNKKKINCFITSTFKEYESIAGDRSPYIFGKKEVRILGLPRHDQLIKNFQNKTSKTILIMPTWRSYLNLEGSRDSFDQFRRSEYYLRWQSLLSSEGLKKLIEKNGYEIIFFPHANIQKYAGVFEVPAHIKLATHFNNRIQDFLLKANLLITDYSSVAFEMGIQRKEVVYYQFDRAQFFSGTHTSQQGYFDFDKDGFGPICFSDSDVLSAVGDFLSRDGKVGPEYIKRMGRTFAYFDGKNCERVYRHLLSMSNAFGNHQTPKTHLPIKKEQL